MKTYQRIAICLLASIVIALGIFVLPMDAEATVNSGYCGNNLTWTLDDAGTLTISGTGPMYNYNYASMPWVNERSSIKSVVIEDGVTTIGNYAFYSCPNLISLAIPDSVTTVGEYAIAYCSSLPEVIIPASVTAIGTYAFYNCNRLASVYISDIGAWCEISFSDGYANPLFYAYNLYVNGERITDVVIPEGVTKIPYGAFACNHITSVTIPSSVTAIDNGAFSSDSLIAVYISDIAAWCKISFGKNNANPLSYAKNLYLNNELVTDLILPDGIVTIPNHAFYNCTSLTSVTIPASVTTIGEYAFYTCTSLTSVTIPDNVTSIGTWAFYNCTGLTSATIGDGVTTIGTYVFGSCSSLTSVTIGNGIKSIAAGMFASCSKLTTVTIPSGVDSIGRYAFEDCSRLTSVTIPASVTSIGSDTFYGCTRLTSVYISDVAAWCAISYGNIYAVPTFYANKLYLNNELITDLVIPDKVTAIPNYAFSCENIVTVTIGKGITKIVDRVFQNCTNLTSVTIPNNVTSIGDRAFAECTSLTSVTIPDSVTKLGGYVFYHCSSLTTVITGNGITTIGDSAFADCYALTTVDIGNSVKNFGYRAFYNCTALTKLTIPGGVTSVGNDTFSGCSALTTVMIPVSVTTIGNSAFKSCTKLTDVYYAGSESQWNAISIGSYNDYLINATIHYAHTHDYTADPTTCGICGNVRVTLAITKANLRPSCAGMYFGGTFTFDNEVAVARYGIAVSLYNKLPVADDSDEESRYTIGTTSALIANILTTGNGAANAKKPVYARAYVLLEDGTMLYGDVVAISLKSLVEAVDGKAYESLKAAQKEALNEMYRQYTAIMGKWNVPNMKEYGQV